MHCEISAEYLSAEFPDNIRQCSNRAYPAAETFLSNNAIKIAAINITSPAGWILSNMPVVTHSPNAIRAPIGRNPSTEGERREQNDFRGQVPGIRRCKTLNKDIEFVSCINEKGKYAPLDSVSYIP